MSVPGGLLYTKDHEWVRKESEDVVILGITHYAQEKLGDVVFWDQPEVGGQFDQQESIGVVESVKAVSDVYIPVGGEIIACNEALEDHPELINASPYEEGWLVKIKVADVAQLDALLSDEAYRALIEGA